jgi:hypothetical protein
MIAYIDRPPTVESRGHGFVLTFTSGDTETQLFLTLHAMTGLSERGRVSVREAQAKAARAIPFQAKRGGG